MSAIVLARVLISVMKFAKMSDEVDANTAGDHHAVGPARFGKVNDVCTPAALGIKVIKRMAWPLTQETNLRKIIDVVEACLNAALISPSISFSSKNAASRSTSASNGGGDLVPRLTRDKRSTGSVNDSLG